MLAIADASGVVSASIPGLASVSNVSVDAARAAVAKLEDVDADSRTKDFDGRRIEPIDGGWHILNYGKYRRMLSEEERKEYKARWIADRRSVDKSRQSSTARRHKSTLSTQAEAEANKEVHPLTPSRGKPATIKDVVDFIGEQVANEFWDYYESNGWRVGRNPMKDWKAAARRWKRQQSTGNGRQPVRFQDRKKRREQLQEELNAQFRLAEKDHSGRAIFTEEEKIERQRLQNEMQKYGSGLL